MATYLKFQPADRIVLNLASNEQARTVVTVENTATTAVAFKVKTTQPKRYLVKPNQGILEPGQTERIQIQIVPKDRAALAAKPTQGMADRFLIQAVPCEEKLAKLERDSEAFVKELSALWAGVDKASPQQQSAKFSVGFETPLGAGGGSSIPDATAAFGTERVKELLTRGGGGGNDNDPAEVATMRRKYDDLVSYTVSLTAERDRLKQELEVTKKDYNKAVVARVAAEKGGSGGGRLGGAALAGKQGAASGFSFVQLLLIAAIAFVVGKYLEELKAQVGAFSS